MNKFQIAIRKFSAYFAKPIWMEHKVLMDSGIEAKKAMNDISMCLFSSRPHYETIEAILKIIEEYENKLKG